MSGKSGRVRCGVCDRVLYDPAARKGLQAHESEKLTELRREWSGVDFADDQSVGRLNQLFDLVTGRARPLGESGRVVYVDGQPWRLLACRCGGGRKYAVPSRELQQRRAQAVAAGNDLVLGREDEARRRFRDPR